MESKKFITPEMYEKRDLNFAKNEWNTKMANLTFSFPFNDDGFAF